MPGHIMQREHFSVMSTHGGGVTGSGQVTGPEGATYQLKLPIQDAPLKRKIKAFRHDHENFQEEIAARIAKELMPEDPDNPGQRIPDVTLVEIPGKDSAGIVSKYIAGEKETLNHYVDPNNKRPPRDSKKPDGRLVDVKFIDGPSPVPYQQNLNTPENGWLRKELARVVAVSALVGDHDVNPGNILVVTEDGKKRLARIDFGHAFADQVRFPRFGGERIHPNNIIDYLNRKTLDDVPKPGESKLWRSYPALMRSQELVDAMKEIASVGAEARIHAALLVSKASFAELLDTKGQDKTHILDSLKYIAEHVGQCKISSEPKETLLDRLFQTMENYICNNLGQMRYAAEIMQLQVDIDKYLNNVPGAPNQHALHFKYNSLQNSQYGPFSWIRNADRIPVFKGDFSSYLRFRSEQIKSNADELMSWPSGSSSSEFALIDDPGATSENSSPLSSASSDSKRAFVDYREAFHAQVRRKSPDSKEPSDSEEMVKVTKGPK